MSNEAIGQRVSEAIPAGATQSEVAERIGLTPEKFSRSLHGKRAFSAVELAQLAEVLGVEVFWLITGQADPNRIVVAARHDFDQQTGERTVPGQAADEVTFSDIKLAYEQAFQDWSPPAVSLPTTPAGVREVLGPGFVRPLAHRIETQLDVDVIHLPKLTTAYSFLVGPRRVIVVPATANWFRENWSLAHELGHHVADHHQSGLSKVEWDRHEAAANAFAAELLLPAVEMRAWDWIYAEPTVIAQHVWDLGVSTDALATRLRWLGIETSEQVDALLRLSTPKLLRRYWAEQRTDGPDEITDRMDGAAVRRFPRKLQEAHRRLIAAGMVSKRTLAWMLDTEAEDLEVEEPEETAQMGLDALAAALGH